MRAIGERGASEEASEVQAKEPATEGASERASERDPSEGGDENSEELQAPQRSVCGAALPQEIPESQGAAASWSPI